MKPETQVNILLQWGRARASAEMASRRRLATEIFTLQWGRARASAEMSLDCGALVIASAASMGPRSCERGNQDGLGAIRSEM